MNFSLFSSNVKLPSAKPLSLEMSIICRTVGRGEIARNSVFYPFDELFAIFIKCEIAHCKAFEFGRVESLSFGKGLIRQSKKQIVGGETDENRSGEKACNRKLKYIVTPGSVFTKHSKTKKKKAVYPFFQGFYKRENKTTSDWLNRMVCPFRSCVTFKCFSTQKKN